MGCVALAGDFAFSWMNPGARFLRRSFRAAAKVPGPESRYTHSICAQGLSRRLADHADDARKRVFCVAPECGGELFDNLLKPGRGESRH
jgi:hypothetical protein